MQQDTLGTLLRDRRQELGISEREITRKLGFKSPTSYCDIEHGRKKTITLGQLRVIAEILNLDLNTLIYDERLRDTRIPIHYADFDKDETA